MNREELIEFLKNNLTLDLKTSSEYTGGYNGELMYQDSKTLLLKLDGIIISEVYL
jgi:hypothetical protein